MSTYHFIGIGGAGMSGIARIMLSRGYTVTGSDAKESSVVEALRAHGAHVFIGHDGSHVEGADTVVVSSAIRHTNPEIVRAEELGIPVIHRSDALATLMEGKRTIAIAGTHGKTTTTSMTTVALQAAGKDPSFAIGGQLSKTGTNAHAGSGDVFIAEADESDGSFLKYRPEVGVITNAEADHLDHYGSWERVREAFVEFGSHVGNMGGTLIVCADDKGAASIGREARKQGTNVILYGESDIADARVNASTHGQGVSVSIAFEGQEYAFDIALPGTYNALNATAAFLSARAVGGDPQGIIQGLESFTGTRRRFELRGIEKGVRVYDDYAHHPTEVTALLTAAKKVVDPSNKVHVIFQPHLFTRTKNFYREFARALSLADDVIVLDVFPAREDPIPGVTGELIAREVTSDVTYVPAFSDAVPTVAERVKPGDIVLTVGAGDVTILGPELLGALAQ